MKLADLKIDTGPPKILIYGEVGAGKTALALTLGERCHYIEVSPWEVRTGLSIDDKWKPERLKVDVKQIHETDPRKPSLFSATKNYIYGLGGEIKAGRFPFDAVVLDNLSALAEAAVNTVLANSGKLGGNPEIQHWGLAFTEIKNVIGVLRTLPVVVVLIAHEQVKSVGSGVDKEDKLEIAISGKNLPSQICRYFDEILYLRAKNIGQGKRAYKLQTVSDARLAARSRANLPNDLDTSVGLWEIIKMMGYEPPKKGK